MFMEDPAAFMIIFTAFVVWPATTVMFVAVPLWVIFFNESSASAVTVLPVPAGTPDIVPVPSAAGKTFCRLVDMPEPVTVIRIVVTPAGAAARVLAVVLAAEPQSRLTAIAPVVWSVVVVLPDPLDPHPAMMAKRHAPKNRFMMLIMFFFMTMVSFYQVTVIEPVFAVDVVDDMLTVLAVLFTFPSLTTRLRI